jgi:hypothetical protein
MAFLNHIKQFPGVCNQGTKITIKTAHGKGARHVIDCARRQTLNADFDQVAVMLDTDTNWTLEAANLAKKNHIQVIKSVPCFEALLLRLIGEKPGKTNALKKQFAPFVNRDATDQKNYSTHFGQSVLLLGRSKETAINELLKLFNL